MSIKEIQTGYLASPYFKNIYLYLAQNELHSSKVAVRQVETQAERYLLLDLLLFRIQNSYDVQKSELCTPKYYVDYIFDVYHNLLLDVHEGCLRTS